ncbi:MAG: RloB domain-containing protein [Xanthomonadales bacterium]|nr:RloB domain-containing protein [Xanthomonadales bacterium]
MAKPKSHRQLRRSGPKREPYDRVLIVCEGEKTEPNYLRELIEHHRLSTANVTITGDSGSAPTSVVEYAIELFDKDPDYNAVFCVFDRDGHPSFDQAIHRTRGKSLIRRSGKIGVGSARFEAITSIPCFEYWLLLHYEYTTAPLPRFADVEPRLRAIAAHASYAKGNRGLFNATSARLSTAMANADRANAAAAAASTDNPTTQMPVLIRYLVDLADKKTR